MFSVFFAGEARHRDVDDEGGRPVGRAVRRVAGDDSEGAFVVVHGQQLGPLLEMIVEDGVRLRAVDGAGRRRNRDAEHAGEDEARQGATGHVYTAVGLSFSPCTQLRRRKSKSSVGDRTLFL